MKGNIKTLTFRDVCINSNQNLVELIQREMKKQENIMQFDYKKNKTKFD